MKRGSGKKETPHRDVLLSGGKQNSYVPAQIQGGERTTRNRGEKKGRRGDAGLATRHEQEVRKRRFNQQKGQGGGHEREGKKKTSGRAKTS